MERHDTELTGFVVEQSKVRLYSKSVGRLVRFVFIADVHLGIDDERGNPYRELSSRMAGAYAATRHYRTGQPTTPQESFLGALRHARKRGADLVLIGGDLLSFPSCAAAEWARARLDEAMVPFLYVAGNHDWHFEGMPGSSAELRAWGERRLTALYGDRDPLMASCDLNGLRLVLIDNGTYEITPEQLAYYRDRAAAGLPTVLIVHSPLYVPGRDVGYGCGHPEWGAATDRNHKIERREQWPQTGHTETTMTFRREVFGTPNLLGVFAGHTHRPAIDVVSGVPLFVTPATAQGGFLEVEIAPTP